MARDTSGHLKSLVQAFINDTNPATRATTLTTLIYTWAGVENVDPASRGGDLTDARTLGALEAFLGRGYLDRWGQSNPNVPAARVLVRAFERLTTSVNTALLAQTDYKPFLEPLTLAWNTTTQNFDLDVTQVAARLRARYDANPAAGYDFIESFGRFLRESGESGQRIRAALRALGNPDGSGFVLELASLGCLMKKGDDNDNSLSGETDQENNLIGLGGNDILYGANSADTLEGNTGVDWLYGDDGTDTLSGSAGNDYLTGGNGDDLYLFNKGDGRDAVVENLNEGSDTLKLGAGITAAGTTFKRENTDLVLNFNANDSVRVIGYFTGGVVEKIQFADGTKWDYTWITDRITFEGSDAADTLYGTSDVANRMYGLGGNVSLWGGGFGVSRKRHRLPKASCALPSARYLSTQRRQNLQLVPLVTPF